MNSMAKYLMQQYGEEEDVDDDDVNLIQQSFWSGIRASLYKKIAGKGGKENVAQWAYITGKRSRNKDGSNICLTERTEKFLWQTVQYLNSSEGLEELQDMGIKDPPEHVDELIDEIANAKNDREIKRDQFRLFLKHKHRIMKFLLE